MAAASQWYRFEATRSGYEPYYSYAFHDGYHEECTVYDCSEGKSISGQCMSFEEFQLWPDDVAHERLPDLFPDPRDLAENYRQCAVMDPTLSLSLSQIQPGDDPTMVIGLRVSTGTANVGSGPLHIEQLAPGGFCANGEWPCPQGTYCETGSGQCLAAPCDGANPCPTGMVCDQSNHCALPACNSDSDCSVLRSSPNGSVSTVPLQIS